jgi:D-lactate dehydrogenase (cytochrome)
VQPPTLRSGDALATRLQDAARTPGGHAPVLALPEDEGQVAWVLRAAPAVLAIGAQSSLTGGATPFGEWLLATERLDAVRVEAAACRVSAGAGVALTTLQAALDPHGLWYPPVPTFRGAFVGGTLSTNAAGAATFKYGSTRAWVEALTVVLADGAALDLERGQCRAHPEGFFEIESARGDVTRIPLPGYTLPDVAKRSAGYHAEPGLDLVDLFAGSEGTLGVITEARLRLLPAPAAALAWVALDSEAAALALVAALRAAARATWRANDPRGIDVASIESLDRRCLELLREDGHEIADGDTALLIDLELPRDGAAADAALEAFAALAGAHADPGRMLLALPGDAAQRARLLALREAVPEGVNRRAAEVQRRGDARVHKVAADMIVPFEALPEMVGLYRAGFERRGLDHALWGHVSDGNLHANVLPRSWEDVRAGHEAILEFGLAAARLGGCPLSEHGVGRNPVKQELLRRLYGDAGVAQMRAVKTALDPEGKLAPGVLFPAR